MGLKHRLDRLEKRAPPDPGPAPPLPPDFFLVMGDLSLLETAHPVTQQIIEPMVRPFGSAQPVAERPDPIDQEIDAIIAGQLTARGLPRPGTR